MFRNFVTLDGQNYEYETNTWSRRIPIRSSRNTTQNTPSFQYSGLDAGTQDITLILQTAGANVTSWGATTNGESLLQVLINSVDKLGSSMPLLFTNPVGATYSVVPVGQLEISTMRPWGNSNTPVEYRVPITLAELS